MGLGVQTNEVGRAASLFGGFHAVGRRWGLPLRQLEVGASAGLLLRWDRFGYRAAPGWRWGGDEGVGVRRAVDRGRAAGRRTASWSPSGGAATERRSTRRPRRAPCGCDRSSGPTRSSAEPASMPPSTSPAGTRWPSTRPTPASGPRRSWPNPPRAWPPWSTTRSCCSTCLASRSCGCARPSRAPAPGPRPDAPVHWLRMEPAGDVADVRMTSWPGTGSGPDEELAGHHRLPRPARDLARRVLTRPAPGGRASAAVGSDQVDDPRVGAPGVGLVVVGSRRRCTPRPRGSCTGTSTAARAGP